MPKLDAGAATGWHRVEITYPSRMTRSPSIPGSISDVRSGVFDLKKGPVVCRGVAGSSSPHAGVGGR
jgi:hypothetical protein